MLHLTINRYYGKGISKQRTRTKIKKKYCKLNFYNIHIFGGRELINESNLILVM